MEDMKWKVAQMMLSLDEQLRQVQSELESMDTNESREDSLDVHVRTQSLSACETELARSDSCPVGSGVLALSPRQAHSFC